MPLPPSVRRDELHLRRIDLRGYRRHDGLYDIEARMVDTKTGALRLTDGTLVPPGEALHDMSIRMVVDEALTVIDIVAATDASPFGVCREATDTLRTMRGLRIAHGFSQAVRERLSGRSGCTHLTELLGPLATVAFQTLSQLRQAKPTAVDANGKPLKIDSCYAYASDREVVQRLWPVHYDGPRGRALGGSGATRSSGE
jgi:hypothetical protein